MDKIKCNIEDLVINSGLQKKFIAERLNVSVKQFRNYETGKSLIPMDKAFTLATMLQCKVDDLYSIEK